MSGRELFDHPSYTVCAETHVTNTAREAGAAASHTVANKYKYSQLSSTHLCVLHGDYWKHWFLATAGRSIDV